MVQVNKLMVHVNQTNLSHPFLFSPRRVSIMAACSVSTEEFSFRPAKTPKLDGEAVVKSKPYFTQDRLRSWEPEKDEYIRQYLLFHYDFHRTQGFGIEWEKFDYCSNLCKPYDGAPPISGTKQSNEEVIQEVTLKAIAKYNQENGTNLVFVEHVSANYLFSGYMEHWLTFWARDMSSPSPESKLYQVHALERSGLLQIPIFRVKPTDEEMMAAPPVHVDPPFPMYYDIDKPPPHCVTSSCPGEVLVPGTPFVFERDGVKVFESDEEE